MESKPGSAQRTWADSAQDAVQAARGDHDGVDVQRAKASVLGGLFGTATQAVKLGRFTVLDVVGAGAMGRVYLAFDPELDRKVAVKVLSVEGRGDPHARRQRLIREARALAKLSHPNVVTVFEVGTAGDDVYVAMEYIDGQSIRHWLRERPRTTAEIVAAFVQAGQGLVAAHAQNLVHRDFKPDNVLMGRDGRVRVVDFGLARFDRGPPTDHDAPNEGSGDDTDADPADPAVGATMTRTGAILGTPAYMPPEQFTGSNVDALSDQFSFCVTLFEALYGARPFPGATAAAIYEAACSGRIETPPGVDIPAWLDAVVRHGLAAEPSDRHRSMAALLTALRRNPAARRRRVGVAALLTVLAAGSAWGLARPGHEPPPRCPAPTERVAAAFGTSTGPAIRNAFVATGDPDAAAVSDRVNTALADYASGWSAAHVDACQAHHVRGEQSGGLLDQRMACLSERLRELEVLSQALATADRAMVRRAPEAVARLPPVSACADPESVAERFALPDGPARDTVAQTRELLAEANALRIAGRYALALQRAEEASGLAEGVDFPPLRAPIHQRLGQIHSALDDDDDAESALRLAFFAAVENHQDGPAFSAADELVRVTGSKARRLDVAKEWAEHAGAYLRRTGSDPAAHAELLHDLGGAHYRGGELERADTLLRQALSMREGLPGRHELAIASTTNDLGLVALDQGDLARARGLFERSHTAVEARFGPDHLRTTEPLNNLAIVAAEAGDGDEALRLHRRILAIRTRTLPPGHPAIARAAGNVGNALFNLDRIDEAAEHHLRALAGLEAALGPDHIDVAATLTGLAVTARKQDRPDLARAHHLRALQIRAAVLGPDHPGLVTSLSGLGQLELDEGNWTEALAHYERARAIMEAAAGPDHPALAFPVSGAGVALFALGRQKPGIDALRRALELRRAAGIDPLTVAESELELGEALWFFGRRAQAQPLLDSAKSTYEAAGQPDTAIQIEAWVSGPKGDYPSLLGSL